MKITREPKPCSSGCWYHLESRMFGMDHRVNISTNWGRLKYACVWVGWEPLEVNRDRLALALRAARADARQAKRRAA